MQTKPLENAIEKVSRVLTDRYGMNVVFQGNSCHTDGKTIYLPSLPPDVPDALVEALRGWADHECAHALFTETDVKSDFVDQYGEQAFSVLNVLEDARVEDLMARRYLGAGLNFNRGFRYITQMADGRPPPDPLKAFTVALYTRATTRDDLDYLPDDIYRLADRCQSQIAQVKSCSSTAEVAELAGRVWEKVADDLENIEERSGEDDTNELEKTQPDAPGEAGDSGECDSSDDTSADEQPSSRGEGQDTGDFSPDTENKTDQKHTEGADSPASQDGQTTGEDKEPGSDTDVDHSPMGQLQCHIQQQIESRDGEDTYRVYTRQHDEVEVPEADPSYDWKKKAKKFRPQISGLLRKLLHTLRGRQEKRWLRGRSRGKLDPGSLHRLVTGQSGRIFRQHSETSDGPTACTLLLDLSSSMAGDQIRMARRLALIFGETLSRLSYPTEIIGFSTVGDDMVDHIVMKTKQDREVVKRRYSRTVPLYHSVLKQFGESWAQAAPRMGNAHTRSLTPLGESLIFSGRRLASRPEFRKVLFCLTDGKPVVGAWDESVTQSHACESVNRLTAAGIEPVGIGIMERCVEDIFPRHVVISQLDNLATSFARELCEVLTGHTGDE